MSNKRRLRKQKGKVRRSRKQAVGRGRRRERDGTGKEVERLVAAIEKALLPENFNVSLRQKPTNDEGQVIAEFDIVISGKMGTTQFKWLIECRDRPSDGKAPGSWIEQLVGRRDRFNFAKVIAVSTSGFSSSAIDYARQKGIITRSVEFVTDIAKDFSQDRHRVEVYHIETDKCLFSLCEESGLEKESVRELATMRLRLGPNRPFSDFPSCLVPRVQRDRPKWLSIEARPEDLEKVQRCEYPMKVRIKRPQMLLKDGRVLQLKQLTASLRFVTESFPSVTLKVSVYSEDGARIGYVTEALTETPYRAFRHKILCVDKEDGEIEVREICDDGSSKLLTKQDR